MYFFSAEDILFPVNKYICILVVGNTPYGKRHISLTEPLYGKLNVLDESLHSLQFFFIRYQISSIHSSTRKMPQKSKPKILLQHLLVNLKNV